MSEEVEDKAKEEDTEDGKRRLQPRRNTIDCTESSPSQQNCYVEEREKKMGKRKIQRSGRGEKGEDKEGRDSRFEEKKRFFGSREEQFQGEWRENCKEFL